MENIFKDAKFGDKFLTRDNRLAIYHYSSNPYWENPTLVWHHLIVDSIDDNELICTSDGLCIGNHTEFPEWDDDIVSKWQDIIDEKELDRLADKDCPYFADTSRMERQDWVNGFKAGYKKALE